MSADFDGKVALVTGAAGGVGTEIVRLLVERGASVVAEDIAPRVADLESLRVGRVAALCADIAEPGVAEQAVAIAIEQFGRLDVLVNNAGRFLIRSLANSTDDDWDDLMTINAKSAFRHTKAATGDLEAAGRDGDAAIVNVASVSAVLGLADQAVYSASKGAMLQLTRVAATECARRGIRVNAVAPGAIETPLLTDPIGALPHGRERLAAIADLHPVGRLAHPAEIAEAVCFLASSRASFVTGAVLIADGGFTTI